jgi:hypothetical protein
MSTLTFSSFDAFGNTIASAHLLIDRRFELEQYLVWHMSPQQHNDLFDFTSGLKGRITWFNDVSSPNGWAYWTPPNTLMMFFGNYEHYGLFAHLYNVLTLDEEGENWVSDVKGVGWLFRGRRLPSGTISWSVE